MKYVLDTHILLYHLLNYSNKLSKQVQEILNVKVEYREKFRFRLGMTFHDFIQHLKDRKDFIVYPIDIQVLKIASQIPIYEVPEFPDRLIIATAIINQATLITLDEEIVRYCQKYGIPYLT